MWWRYGVRVAVPLLCVLMLAACGDDGDGRDPRDAEAMFQAVMFEAIPPGTGNLVSTGYITGANTHNIYLRFETTVNFLAPLLSRYAYQQIDCADEQLQGRITLPQELEADIPDWRSFVNDAVRCYTSPAGYRNPWTNNGSSVLVIRTDALIVYFNETGQTG